VNQPPNTMETTNDKTGSPANKSFASEFLINAGLSTFVMCMMSSAVAIAVPAAFLTIAAFIPLFWSVGGGIAVIRDFRAKTSGQGKTALLLSVCAVLFAFGVFCSFKFLSMNPTQIAALVHHR